MKKKLISTLLAAAVVLTMGACGVSAPETSSVEDAATPAAGGEATITLVMAEVNPLDSVAGMTDQKFKEEVEARSNGTIKIDLQAGAVLGPEDQVLDQMLGGGGNIDIARISPFSLTPYGAEKTKLMSLPYTFVNRDHYWNFATSDLAQEFLLEPHENGSGVRGLFYGEEGFRHFFSNEDISTIDAFNGMKVRVSDDPVMNGLVKGLGANPTVISFNELYSALQTGVVDAAEQPISNYKTNAFPEVANNMVLDGHTIGALEVIIADSTWDSLTEEQQQILIEAGEATQEYNKKISEEQENTVLEQLKADGVNIIEVDDLTPWQDAVKPVIEDNIKGQEDIYQQIVDMQ